MPTRLLALVAAVAMVVGAVALRSRLDQHKQDTAHPLRLACMAELNDFCQSLVSQNVEVRVEPAGVTADRLAKASGDDAGIDGWVTAAPWPAMVDQARATAGLPALFKGSTALASSTPAMAVLPERYASLQRVCGTVTWKCVGDAAGKQTWPAFDPKAVPGAVRFAVVDPADSAVGLTVLAAASSDYFGGRTNLSTADLDDDGYQTWLLGLSRARADVTDVNAFLTQPVADVYASIEAEVRPAIARSARLPKPAALYPSPTININAVVAVLPGRAGQRLGSIVTAAKTKLVASGWRADAAAGATEFDPGFLTALRAAWKAA